MTGTLLIAVALGLPLFEKAMFDRRSSDFRQCVFAGLQTDEHNSRSQEDSPLNCKLATDCTEMLPVSTQVGQKSGSDSQSLRSLRSVSVKKQTGKHCGSTPRMERFSPKTIAVVPASNKSDH